MPRRWLIFIFAAALLLAIAIFSRTKEEVKKSYNNVKNFEDCVKENFPVMESYPRQCKTPDGRIFSEIIKDELNKMNR